MNEDLPPRTEAGDAVEAYDHSPPAGFKLVGIASLLFFAGGQLVKGQFLKALGLWVLLLGLVAGGVGLTVAFTEAGSTSRSVGLAATIGAVIVLWLYQLWDAAFRP